MSERTAPRIERVFVRGQNARKRMHHQPFADEARRIGKSVWIAGAAQHEEKPRRPDAIRAQDDDLCALAPVSSVGVHIDQRARQARSVSLDLLDPGFGFLASVQEPVACDLTQRGRNDVRGDREAKEQAFVLPVLGQKPNATPNRLARPSPGNRLPSIEIAPESMARAPNTASATSVRPEP